MHFNVKYAFIWASILWAIVIFILCSLPGEDLPDPQLNIPHLDKAVHFGMFFILAVLLVHLLKFQGSLSTKLIYTVTIVASLVYGGAIELLQHYFFNRSGDVYDLLADLAGGIAGCLCYPLIARFLPYQRKD